MSGLGGGLAPITGSDGCARGWEHCGCWRRGGGGSAPRGCTLGRSCPALRKGKIPGATGEGRAGATTNFVSGFIHHSPPSSPRTGDLGPLTSLPRLHSCCSPKISQRRQKTRPAPEASPCHSRNPQISKRGLTLRSPGSSHHVTLRRGRHTTADGGSAAGERSPRQDAAGVRVSAPKASCAAPLLTSIEKRGAQVQTLKIP